MAKRKRKLTAAEMAEKKRRRKAYMTIFIKGKQKRVKRPPTIDGTDVDEFIRRPEGPVAVSLCHQLRQYGFRISSQW
jgi:hypothetical protein